jgi:hypothetical protein
VFVFHLPLLSGNVHSLGNFDRIASRLFHSQSLFEKVRQVIQHGRLTRDQRRARRPRRSLKIVGVVRSKRDDGDMLRVGILSEVANRAADIVAGRDEVGQDEHGSLLLSAGYECVGIGDRLNAVIQILQTIHQLAARQ